MNTLKKLKIHRLLSMITTAIGVMLLTYMIFVEDEPGAIPLLLIVIGTGWYFISQSRIRAQHN